MATTASDSPLTLQIVTAGHGIESAVQLTPDQQRFLQALVDEDDEYPEPTLARAARHAIERALQAWRAEGAQDGST